MQVRRMTTWMGSGEGALGTGTFAHVARRDVGVQPTVAADVLVLMQRATESLSEAAALIDRASDLPAILARNREPPPPSERERSDWYIEPLLTLKQVSQLLGVSPRRARSLPLKAVDLDGQVRYQPAELRRFLATRRVP